MQRGVKVEQVREAVSLCKQNGIQTGMFLMWGYEGEDLSDIEATVEHVKKTAQTTLDSATTALGVEQTALAACGAVQACIDLVTPLLNAAQAAKEQL